MHKAIKLAIINISKRYLALNGSLRKSIALAFAIVSAIFTFVPESAFSKHVWLTEDAISEFCIISGYASELNVTLNRLICLIFAIVICSAVMCAIQMLKWKVTIRGNNYEIQIRYGNLLRMKKCKRVINFDECYTTTVGNRPNEIKPTSVCGQYLATHAPLEMSDLICQSQIVPRSSPSQYKNLPCYQPGTIVPNGNDLLMAFARLDEHGCGCFFTRDEYLDCLSNLWKEIDRYYGQENVCIPLLGAGLTRFEDSSGASISKQDLLDLLVLSYKISSHKIKSPHKLIIVCKRSKGFSINHIAS